VNQNGYGGTQLSGLRFWIVLLLIIWLLGSIGLGWLVKSFLILIAIILIAPVIGFLGFRWWLKRNLIVDRCPVCSTEVAGINGAELRCPNCAEPLKVEQGRLFRLTPPGTVDVDAIDVTVKQIED
jgi:hypothetical protein